MDNREKLDKALGLALDAATKQLEEKGTLDWELRETVKDLAHLTSLSLGL